MIKVLLWVHFLLVVPNPGPPGPPHVLSMSRWAVKGLSSDPLSAVSLLPGETMPNDRRYALLDLSSSVSFDPSRPEWIHKGSFLCAFTSATLLRNYRTSFNDDTSTLSVYSSSDPPSTRPLLEESLDTASGKIATAAFFSAASQRSLELVSARSDTHTHQFGNTGSGGKHNNDTRTVHIVNAATVRNVCEVFGLDLSPERFRSNLVIDGVAPWKEFDWVGKNIKVGTVTFRVLSRTVRCAGVSDDEKGLDIPGLLQEHFPQHGPYLGIYAQCVGGGTISLGDTILEP